MGVSLMNGNDLFYESYQRCKINEDFITTFLDDFCQANPRFAERFSHVEHQQQAKMLKASIILIFNAATLPSVRQSVANLGKKHKDMGLNISEEEFDAWRESLLRTVKQYDGLYNEEVEQAWEDVLALGLDIMKSECC